MPLSLTLSINEEAWSPQGREVLQTSHVRSALPWPNALGLLSTDKDRGTVQLS